jgi:hypothetical protein
VGHVGRDPDDAVRESTGRAVSDPANGGTTSPTDMPER